MSEEVEKLKKPTAKKPVRYFSDINKDGSTDVRQIKPNFSKKPAFDGEVIQVDGREKFYGKSKWKNKRPGGNHNKFVKRNKKMVQLQIDPYARDRHTRKFQYFQYIK